VQARLGLVFSPAPEIDDHIGRYGLGVITSGTTAQSLVDALQGLTAEDVERFKRASDAAARELSSETDMKVQGELVARLLAARP